MSNVTDLERALTARRDLENEMREINQDASFEERSPFEVRDAVVECQQITVTKTGSAYQADSYDLYIGGERVGSLQEAIRVMFLLLQEIKRHERNQIKTLEEKMKEERVYPDFCRTSSRKRW